MKPYVENVYTTLQELEVKAKEHFKFHQHDGRGGFKKVGEEDIEKARLTLTLVENFHIVCKPIDEKLAEFTSNLTAKLIKKCMAMFDHHKDNLFKALS